ncbi:hypothetical protein RBI22_15135 [Alcaligenaceae bacterium C4P045]|nr:hypothetical protein [Alcaligenaceae bacterium C4P045]
MDSRTVAREILISYAQKQGASQAGLSKSFMVGMAGASALIVGQLSSITEFVPALVVRQTLILFLISIAFGAYVQFQHMLITMSIQTATRLTDLQKSLSLTEDELQEVMDQEDFSRQMEKSTPWLVRMIRKPASKRRSYQSAARIADFQIFTLSSQIGFAFGGALRLILGIAIQ